MVSRGDLSLTVIGQLWENLKSDVIDAGSHMSYSCLLPFFWLWGFFNQPFEVPVVMESFLKQHFQNPFVS